VAAEQHVRRANVGMGKAEMMMSLDHVPINDPSPSAGNG